MLTVQSTYIIQQSPTINLAVTSQGEFFFFFLLNQVHSIDYYLGVNIPFPELRYAKTMRSHMCVYYERTEKPWNI